MVFSQFPDRSMTDPVRKLRRPKFGGSWGFSGVILLLPSCAAPHGDDMSEGDAFPEVRLEVVRQGDSYLLTLHDCGRGLGSSANISVFESADESRPICSIKYRGPGEPLKKGDAWLYGTLPQGYEYYEKLCPALNPGTSYVMNAGFSTVYFSLDNLGNVVGQLPSCKAEKSGPRVVSNGCNWDGRVE